AGGSGTRLWPLSRKCKPKQFLKLGSGDTLLERTIERIRPLLSSGNHLGFVAPSCYESHLESFLCRDKDFFVSEPEPRNTAGAILLSCAQLLNRSRVNEFSDPVVVFLPSDHCVIDDVAFRKSLTKSIEVAQKQDAIVLLGVKPNEQKKTYGYVCVDYFKSSQDVLKVKKFIEKPNETIAENLLKMGGVYWNTGIYVGRVSTIVKTAREKCPDVWDAVSRSFWGSAYYSDVPCVSFDYALAEKARNLWLIPCECGWNDVGNLHMFLKEEKKAGGKTYTKTFYGKDNLARAGNKKVVFCGVSDICLIETSDTTLVVHKDSVESVKDLVNLLEDDVQHSRLL
ncbi:hypothetical protein KAU11_00985, partial [Candidatus Babeliales bacterium]|nr:hypothetical protein [Candidatus Babeliales bacterium]